MKEVPREKNAVEVPAPEDTAVLQRELDESRKHGEELLTRLAYIQAELENTRKRAERDMEQVVRYATEGLITQLLTILDDLDAAVASVHEDSRRGVALVRENLWKVLRESGLEEIPAAGKPFDPYLHEAIEQVNDDALTDGMVKEVIRKGYRFPIKVIRPSQVTVVKKEGEEHG